MIRPFLPICKLLFLAIFCLSVNGVTRESDLLLRWSFDEGSGSNSQNLIGTGLDVILHPGVIWGNEANGTAKSGYSLDLSSGTSRASVIHDARLQASNDFSILFWFNIFNALYRCFMPIKHLDNQLLVSLFRQKCF